MPALITTTHHRILFTACIIRPTRHDGSVISGVFRFACQYWEDDETSAYQSLSLHLMQPGRDHYNACDVCYRPKKKPRTLGAGDVKGPQPLAPTWSQLHIAIDAAFPFSTRFGNSDEGRTIHARSSYQHPRLNDKRDITAATTVRSRPWTASLLCLHTGCSFQKSSTAGWAVQLVVTPRVDTHSAIQKKKRGQDKAQMRLAAGGRGRQRQHVVIVTVLYYTMDKY